MNAPASRPQRVVRCPACGGPSVYARINPWRPFCCERCRSHDLGAWASEAYRIEVRTDPAPGDEEQAPPR